MPTFRQHMGWRWRLKMMGYGALTAVGCLFALPYAPHQTAEGFLVVGMLLGAVAVLGGFVGLQDHKF